MAAATLAEKIKVKRGELGLSQADLAAKARLTQATISRLETGELTKLMSDAVARLAEALGVTVDFLVAKTESMSMPETLSADKRARAIFRGYENLSEDKRKQLKDFVDYLLEQKKKGGRRG